MEYFEALAGGLEKREFSEGDNRTKHFILSLIYTYKFEKELYSLMISSSKPIENHNRLVSNLFETGEDILFFCGKAKKSNTSI